MFRSRGTGCAFGGLTWRAEMSKVVFVIMKTQPKPLPTIKQILDEHVTLAVESLDRLYLNGYVPTLQTGAGLKRFLVHHLKFPVASPALLGQLTKGYVRQVEDYIQKHQIPVVPFKKGERKDKVARQMRRKHPVQDGVVFVGVAQEKALAFKAGQRLPNPNGFVEFAFDRQPVYVKHFYFYLSDPDFGEAFLKVCTYAPYAVKIYLNGHEWAKRQLAKQNIGYEALDNGFWRCQDPKRLQELCDQLGPEQIYAFLNRWLERLPFPLTPLDREAGFAPRLSIVQMEYSLTQVLDRPVHGREFFEEVIRDNLDLGRPDRVQLLFERKVTRATPGKFATRVITQGVCPSLHIGYKSFDLKQYFKEGRGLRSEGTINNPRDFGVGKDLNNLPHLKRIAAHINHRLLEVERVSQNCRFSQQSMQRLIEPTVTQDGQKAPGLKFGQPRVMALFLALCLFLILPAGFTNRQLRQHVADILGLDLDQYKPGQMTYDLRRLRLKGLICRKAGTHSYELTPYGRNTSLFLARLYQRVLRPGLAAAAEPPWKVEPTHPLREQFQILDAEIQTLLTQTHMDN